MTLTEVHPESSHNAHDEDFHSSEDWWETSGTERAKAANKKR